MNQAIPRSASATCATTVQPAPKKSTVGIAMATMDDFEKLDIRPCPRLGYALPKLIPGEDSCPTRWLSPALPLPEDHFFPLR